MQHSQLLAGMPLMSHWHCRLAVLPASSSLLPYLLFYFPCHLCYIDIATYLVGGAEAIAVIISGLQVHLYQVSGCYQDDYVGIAWELYYGH